MYPLKISAKRIARHVLKSAGWWIPCETANNVTLFTFVRLVYKTAALGQYTKIYTRFTPKTIFSQIGLKYLVANVNLVPTNIEV